MRKILAPLAVALAGFTALAPSHAAAQVIGATWSSTSAGSLNGNAFTFTGGAGTFTTDLTSSSSYGIYALSSNEKINTVQNNTLWSVTFTSPVSNLLLYDVFWRGGPTITFNNSFTVVAGNSGVSTTPTTLTTPGGFATYTNGVLQFSGPITTLSVTNTTGTGGSQGLTFGVVTSSVPEPPPAVLGAVLAAVASAGYAARRRVGLRARG